MVLLLNVMVVSIVYNVSITGVKAGWILTFPGSQVSNRGEFRTCPPLQVSSLGGLALGLGAQFNWVS